MLRPRHIIEKNTQDNQFYARKTSMAFHTTAMLKNLNIYFNVQNGGAHTRN